MPLTKLIHIMEALNNNINERVLIKDRHGKIYGGTLRKRQTGYREFYTIANKVGDYVQFYSDYVEGIDTHEDTLVIKMTPYTKPADKTNSNKLVAKDEGGKKTWV